LEGITRFIRKSAIVGGGISMVHWRVEVRVCAKSV
jgi:hypothetical protein